IEEQNRSGLIHTHQLEDVHELIHQIYSLLSVKEATRTCILSKSWLHAWSTIPSLKFPTESAMHKESEKHRKHLMMVEHTRLEYF
ncbi:F-box/LRR-repeat protein, partial [Tanacetum coccineum]